MGRKRTRVRKHVYFCITVLILLLFLGCTTLEKVKTNLMEQEEGHQYLLDSQKLLYQGDYEGALKECQKILSLSSTGSPKDKALFNMGLIYAYTENPKKDYDKSLGSFEKLTKDYPQSPLIYQAKIWIGVLLDNEKLSQTNDKLNKTNEKLNQVIEKSKQVDIEVEEKKREKPK